ncbi:hypothetical protein GQ607_016369 [Colletotrichum asianum]|uniref:Uncharacterized protein n=1 Tax=Colletotrichum asianum TaxID=702518 RepID=A0A8H3ZHR1_9PEZI|nr:hypothetical protein GQ607_016369 [Colletotrichum asianum]
MEEQLTEALERVKLLEQERDAFNTLAKEEEWSDGLLDAGPRGLPYSARKDRASDGWRELDAA